MKYLRNDITIEKLESQMNIIGSRFLSILWTAVKETTDQKDWLNELDERLHNMVNSTGRDLPYHL
jgi:hypothetical protein